MLSLLPLSFAAGVLTVAAPCIIPVLPGILSGSIGQNKWRPAAIVLGLVVSFTVFGTAFAIVLDFIGLSKDTVRFISIGILCILGFALAMPALYEWVVVKLTIMWRRIHNSPQPSLNLLNLREGADSITPLKVRGVGRVMRRDGFWSAFGIGASLGAIWTPCAGPILGVILTFAATTQDIFQSGLLVFTYALGAGVPMLFIGYGTRVLFLRFKSLASHTYRLRQVAGVILMVWAIALWFGVDRYLQVNLTQYLPQPKL